MLRSFSPIVNKRSRLLILGSMPGIQSLQSRQYYAHPRNLFWRLMQDIFNKPFDTDYTTRTKLLLDNRIALWDVLHSCSRSGSRDSAIRDERPNAIAELLNEYPCISDLAFNGAAAARYFDKHIVLPRQVKLHKLPSTSPAHASLSFAAKREAWSAVIQSVLCRD